MSYSEKFPFRVGFRVNSKIEIFGFWGKWPNLAKKNVTLGDFSPRTTELQIYSLVCSKILLNCLC